jgi:hypothetical protein
LGKEGADVPKDDARLFLVGGDDENHAALAAIEIARPVDKAGEEHGDQRQHERLAAAAAHDEPRFSEAACRTIVSARALAEQRPIVFAHRQAEH